MNDRKIKLVSDRKTSYKKLAPILFGISIGYFMAGTIIYAAYCAHAYSFNFAFLLLIFGISITGFLGFFTYRAIRDASYDYILEITGQDAIFSKIDHWHNKRTDQLLLLTDIKYVEYYPYQDSASIIFHTPYLDMDVPLWPMGNHVQDVLDFLEGTGVKVIDVQSDESIPQ